MPLGYIDAVASSGLVEGWAFDDRRHGEPLLIAILDSNNLEVAVGLANLYRRDLAEVRYAYVRLSERGLSDTALTRQIAADIAAGFVDTSRGAIFVLPQGRSADPPLRASLDALASGSIEGGCRTPLTPAPNMLVATEDLPESALPAIADVRRLVVDEGDDFWRNPCSFYENFSSVTVFAQRRRHQHVSFRSLLNQAYGPSVRVAWT